MSDTRNFYGDDLDYIHLKFGDAQKMYNFTDAFRAKHPKFCEEYEKYWMSDPTCQFRDPLQIVNYVDHWNIPINFYFNFTDTPAKNNEEVKQYLVKEDMPYNYGTYDIETHKMRGWDGEDE